MMTRYREGLISIFQGSGWPYSSMGASGMGALGAGICRKPIASFGQRNSDAIRSATELLSSSS